MGEDTDKFHSAQHSVAEAIGMDGIPQEEQHENKWDEDGALGNIYIYGKEEK